MASEKKRENNVDNEEMDYEGINDVLGHMGKYQRYVFFLACWGSFMPAMVVVAMTFIGFNDVDYRCEISGCDNDTSTFETSFMNYTRPFDEDEKQYESCEMFPRIDNDSLSTCEIGDFNDVNPIKCSKRIYDRTYFQSSTVMDFDLTCDRAWLAPLAGSAYMVGMLIGAITIGDFADRFGRKKGIVLAVCLLGIAGVISAFSPNYIMFLIMRMFTGAGGVGLFQVTFVLAVEFIGAKWRTFTGIIIEVPFALGEAMTGIFAIYIREWRWLQIAVTAPALLLISYFWIMPESVRWLVSQGKRKEAIKIIEKAAKWNGVEVPKHLLENKKEQEVPAYGTVSVTSSRADLVTEDPEGLGKFVVKKTVLDLLRLPNMRKRSFNMFFCWAVTTLCYYGLSSNSGNLGGNVFFNFIMTMLIEIPSYVFSYLVLDRMGRKGTLTFVLLLGGISCIISGLLLPHGMKNGVLAFSLLGKFGAAAAFAIIYVYAAEIFPTEYRSVGIGSCSMCARIGGIIAPLIASLSGYYQALPLFVFGILACISGSLIILLPETTGCELPQTLQESEEFGKDQPITYFTCFNACKRRNDDEAQN